MGTFTFMMKQPQPIKVIHTLSAQEIGEKIIKRPKGMTALEAADKIFTK